MEGIPCRLRPTAQVRRAGAGLSPGCCGGVGLGAVASALLPWSPGNCGDNNLVIAAPTELHTRHLSVPRSPDKTRSPLSTRRQRPGSRGHCPCVLVGDSGGLPCTHVPRTMGAGRASSLDAHVARGGTPDPEVTVSTKSAVMGFPNPSSAPRISFRSGRLVGIGASRLSSQIFWCRRLLSVSLVSVFSPALSAATLPIPETSGYLFFLPNWLL